MNTRRMYTSLEIVSVVLALGAAPARVCAQTSGQEQAPPAQVSETQGQPGVIIKKESRLVLVDAVVTDKKGNYITGLRPKDFAIVEDGIVEKVCAFGQQLLDILRFGDEQKPRCGCIFAKRPVSERNE